MSELAVCRYGLEIYHSSSFGCDANRTFAEGTQFPVPNLIYSSRRAATESMQEALACQQVTSAAIPASPQSHQNLAASFR